MIDHNAHVPMYIQLADQLSDAIRHGNYQAGDKLPSESDLCREFQVSRITVRQALKLLMQKGLVFSVHGKGTFVKAPAMHQDLDKIISFSRALQLKGLEGYTQVHSYHPSLSDPAAQVYLGPEAFNLNLLGYASGSPIVYYRSFFCPALGEKMLAAAREAQGQKAAFSTYDLYSKIGKALSRVNQTIIAMNASPELEHILHVSQGQALMVLESVYYSSQGEVLEYKTGYYRSDIYSFHLIRQI